MAENSLLVFAHDDEAVAFAAAGVPHLVTGVGKINATFALTRALLEATAAGRIVDEVVVLGTAGAVSDAARLDQAFSRIRSRKARGHAVALVELVAKNFSDELAE